MENQDQIKPDGPLAVETYQRLVRARKFIDQCYYLPLDLHQISSEACLSRFHFLRLFRRAFNKTPHQYLTQRRIEKAKELLSSSGLTVTDVCFEVGFESLGTAARKPAQDSRLLPDDVRHAELRLSPRLAIFEKHLSQELSILLPSP